MTVIDRVNPSPPTADGLAALPRPVAVVAGAGGVLGAFHVGAGWALEQRGFVPDLVVGRRPHRSERGRPPNLGGPLAGRSVAPVAPT